VKNKKFITAILLLLLTFSAAAQDDFIQRGCRRGTLRPQGMALRRGAPSGQPKQTGGNFYHGERHQLVVLAAFADKGFLGNETATVDQWNNIFNTVNYSEGSFRGSIHDYFYAQSYENFNVFFDLVYVKVSGNAVKYASDDTDENSQYLVQDIMDVLKQKTDIDWSRYDWNGDGFVNQLLIVYAGKGMNDNQYATDLIWPHQWWMSEHKKDRQEGVYCDPIPVTYSGKEYKVDCYCALSELGGAGDYSSFGVICHEYSHCFGFPDFYYSTNFSINYKTPHDWDIMDHGYYFDRAFCPVSYSAHERWLMGWLTPIELTSAATITSMPALSDKPVAYIIRNDGHEQEFYMVENRQKSGWDAQLLGSGLVIFHVDFDADTWTGVNGAWANPGTNDRYVIFAANNTPHYSSSSGWPYPYSGNNELTDTSSPAAKLNNANGGQYYMSKPITNMTVTNGLASFDFMGGDPSSVTPPSTLLTSPSTILYDIGPVRIVRMSNGEIKKVMKR
jgi:M6 family metalloprotease-like protein